MRGQGREYGRHSRHPRHACRVFRCGRLEPFLRAFFSYGFLLSAREEKLPELVRPFLARGLYAARIGGFRDGSQVMLQQGGRSALLQDWGKQPFIGFGERRS